MFWTIKVQFSVNSSGFHLIYYPGDAGGDLIVNKAAKKWLTYLYASHIH
jgi:beta-mannanase